ncbi:MAG: translation initiation factor IF-3 [Proteobacteria bacterium]|nr:translation initiation factor IF-3 [Pseudomonadota bacterium]
MNYKGEFRIVGLHNTPPTQAGPRINEAIRAENIRCIGADGEQLGVLSIDEALKTALNLGLDLVEIQPNVDPPVCKILDYGKYKYEAQKRKNEAKKKQKIIEIKEIKLRPNIDSNDFLVKMKQVKKFIDNGDKVKITLRFRGREMAHQDIGVSVLDRVKENTEELCKIEAMPKLEGRQMVMILAPK